MNCKTCKQLFGKSFCVACGDLFITCDCKTNICSTCQQEIYSDPAKHRFGIAWFALSDCYVHINENLSKKEEMAKEKLITICHDVVWDAIFGKDKE